WRALRAPPTRRACRLQKCGRGRRSALSGRLWNRSWCSPGSGGVRAARRLEDLTKILLGLGKRVLGSGLGNVQGLADFGVAEALDLVEQEDIALVLGQRGEGAFQRKSQRGMRTRRALLGQGIVFAVIGGHFFLALPAASGVVAGVDQNAEGPSDKARLTAEAGDAALHLEERFLDGVFGIGCAPEQVARKVLHSCAVERIQTLVGAHVSRKA